MIVQKGDNTSTIFAFVAIYSITIKSDCFQKPEFFFERTMDVLQIIIFLYYLSVGRLFFLILVKIEGILMEVFKAKRGNVIDLVRFFGCKIILTKYFFFNGC